MAASTPSSQTGAVATSAPICPPQDIGNQAVPAQLIDTAAAEKPAQAAPSSESNNVVAASPASRAATTPSAARNGQTTSNQNVPGALASPVPSPAVNPNTPGADNVAASSPSPSTSPVAPPVQTQTPMSPDLSRNPASIYFAYVQSKGAWLPLIKKLRASVDECDSCVIVFNKALP